MKGDGMNAPHDNALPASSYGFHSVLQPQTFAHGVAAPRRPDDAATAIVGLPLRVRYSRLAL